MHTYVCVLVCAYPWRVRSNVSSVFSPFSPLFLKSNLNHSKCHHFMFSMKIQIKKRKKWRGGGPERKALKQPHF